METTAELMNFFGWIFIAIFTALLISLKNFLEHVENEDIMSDRIFNTIFCAFAAGGLSSAAFLLKLFESWAIGIIGGICGGILFGGLILFLIQRMANSKQDDGDEVGKNANDVITDSDS